MIKKFVADSYFEAFLKAQTELGEDAVVVTSRTFKDTKWAGMYSREMVEITAMAPKAHSAATRAARPAPLRPVPAEEVQVPPIAYDPPPVVPVRPSAPIPAPHPAPPARRPSPPPAPTYATPSRPRPHLPTGTAQQAHTIRTIHMGDADPQPQAAPPCAGTETIHEDRVAKLLEAILNTRGNRAGNGGTTSPEALVGPELRNSGSFQHFTQKLEEIVSLLNDMQKKTHQALQATPSLLPGMQFLRQRLEAIEMPPHVLADLFACLTRDFPPAVQRDPKLVQEEFTRYLRRKLRFLEQPLPASGPRPHVFILLGPTGVGKTTTIAKLAATFALNVVEGKSVALVTTDTFRIGATGQLAQYAQIIEAALEIAYSPDDIPDLLDRYQAKDIILVDTAGRCQKQVQELTELKRYVDRFPSSTKYLVLSATTKYSDMVENVSRFGKVGFDHLIFTKVDETNSVGPLLALLLETSASLAYITHGQSVPDDFRGADLDFFLQRLFP